MNDNAHQNQKPAPAKTADRTPIRIEKLIFTNIQGIKLPDGPEGKNERILPNLAAGVYGDTKVEIEYRPWMRGFYVVKSKRTTSNGAGKGAAEVVTWVPMGKPYRIPEGCAISIFDE